MYEYVIRNGDTLHKIAEYYGVSVEYILSANQNLSPEEFSVGKRIVIPISRYLDQTQVMRNYWLSRDRQYKD